MNLLQNISLSNVLHIADTSNCLCPKTTSVEDYFMGILLSACNKIAEYDQQVIVYQFALVHLPALLNETDLSRKNTQLNTYCIHLIQKRLLSALALGHWEAIYCL